MELDGEEPLDFSWLLLQLQVQEVSEEKDPAPPSDSGSAIHQHTRRSYET